MSSRLLLSAMVAALFTTPSPGLAQLPDRRLPPSTNPEVANPPGTGTLDPGTGTLDPRTRTLDPGTGTPDPGTEIPGPTIAAPAPVRPGTIQREPAALRSRELVYLTPGEAPANLRVVTTGPRSVSLEWSPTARARAYWVHQSHAHGPYYRGGSSTDTTIFTVTGLLPGTVYGFKVSATYPPDMQHGEGMSTAVSATTASAPAVSGLAAEVSGKEVKLTWDKAPEANWYKLHRNGAALTELRPVQGTQYEQLTHRTAYTDPAGPGTHQYQIQAIYLAGGTQVASALAPSPPVTVTIKASTRVRYCQTTNAPSVCGQSGSKPAVIAAKAALHQLRRNAP